MSRTRSPGYPNFSLREAVKRAERIHKADRRNVIDRENAAIHMGYSGISGAADKALATMGHYGLLERKGKGEVCITQAAVDILHPVSEASRKAALRKAAFRPELFATLRSKFPEGASEGTLKSFLIRENFLDRAIGPAISAYEETCSFLKQEGAYESEGDTDAEGTEASSFDDEDEDADAAELQAPQATQPLRRPTQAQSASVAPGVGHLSMADMQHLPAPGFERAAFPLAEGTVYLTFPTDLSSDGYEELSEYLQIFLKRAQRAKRLQEARDDFGGDA